MKSQWPTPDELMTLAKEDPAALEALRQREIESLIESAPATMQRRLRGLQFQIDAKRSASKTPMGACVAISKMMLDSVYELNNVLNDAKQAGDHKPLHSTNTVTTTEHLAAGKPATTVNTPKTAQVLRFPKAL